MSKKAVPELIELKAQAYQQILDYLTGKGASDRLAPPRKSNGKSNGHDHGKLEVKENEIYFPASRGQGYSSNTWDRMSDNLRLIQDLLASKGIKSKISCDRDNAHKDNLQHDKNAGTQVFYDDPSVILKIDVTQSGFKDNLDKLSVEISGSTAASDILLLHTRKEAGQIHAK